MLLPPHSAALCLPRGTMTELGQRVQSPKTGHLRQIESLLSPEPETIGTAWLQMKPCLLISSGHLASDNILIFYSAEACVHQ